MSERVPLTDYQATKAFERSLGRCKHCHKRISRSNRGLASGRGAHEIDHSFPWARGGSNHGNNLVAVCAGCNREKSDELSASFYKRKAAERQHRLEARIDYQATKALAPAALAGLLTAFLFEWNVQEGSQGPDPDGVVAEPRKPNWWPLYVGVAVFLVLFFIGLNKSQRA